MSVSADFLVSGRDASGATVARYVAAEHETAAVRALEAEGLTAVTPHEDASAAIVRALDEARRRAAGEAVQRPSAERALAGLARPPSRLALAIGGADRYGFALAFVAMTVAFLSGWGWGAVLFTALGLVPALLLAAVLSPLALYSRLEDAILSRDASAAERALEGFVARVRSLKLPVPPLDLEHKRAQVEVLAGRLEAALARADEAALDAGAPEWLRRWRRSALLSLARDFEGAARELEIAAELAPPSASVRLDLALVAALRSHDLPKARAALAGIDDLALTPAAAAVRAIAAGAVALEARDATAARRLLEPLPAILAHPSCRAFAILRLALLAIALAELGDAKAAAAHFAEARPTLERWGEAALLERYRAAAS